MREKLLHILETRKRAVALFLAVLALGTVATGLYLKQYYVAVVFGVWVLAEALLRYFDKLSSLIPDLKKTKLLSLTPSELTELLSLYESPDPQAKYLIEARLNELSFSAKPPAWLDTFRNIFHLKRSIEIFNHAEDDDSLDFQIVAEDAARLAHLLYKVGQISEQEDRRLKKLAKTLIDSSFSQCADLDLLSDAIQNHGGIAFRIFRLIEAKQFDAARRMGQWLLSSKGEMDEDLRSTLYWIAELHWFLATKPELDYESTIRCLYHLCFTNPERGGFLEIDSQFHSQFDTVSDIAREGFLFKETLVENLLMLWESYEGVFDNIFKPLLESVTQRKSKIYDERDTWVRFWKREQETFGREFLYVVEGNVSFAAKEYDDALSFYDKALTLNPSLRPAKLNRLFALAMSKRKKEHTQAVNALIADKSLFPTSLYTIADSYILSGDIGNADAFYEALREVEGWSLKADHYRSTFCYEHGDFRQALKFAKLAVARNPTDTTLRYHLSLCHSALGEKDQALEMVAQLPDRPAWVDYYKFTLERDSGREEEASKTLLQLPQDYFEDSEELEEAVDFARKRKDFVLLRHLRHK